jgi:hypothetical protein
MIERTLDSVKGTFPYTDNSRIRSLDRETHLHHLEAFFAALAAHGLVINLDKCVFAVPTLEFLGHNFLAAGSTQVADHVAAIKTCPPPGHQAIATFSWKGKFLPLFFAKLCKGDAPFNRSPEGEPKTLEWTNKAQEAF